MWSGVLQAVGGVGLFLLGMVVMTEGLRSLAGGALRRTLTRFTRSPSSGAAAGAATTALIQSSSATTVAAVGFVGAGLLTFPQALGVIFGANIGTTITGWLVALLGFKLKLGTLVLPLILVGVLLRLFRSGRLAAAGYAMAGFGLVFVGIGALQSGMAGLEGVVTPDDFPADTLGGRLQLVAIGVGVTLVTQSSSAGVAAALAAVSAGAIHFPQAAAMVIGMDVGTTVTAALAAVGGSVAARRTGFALVIYNLLTGVGALLLLSVWVGGWEAIAPGVLEREPELALVGFHTFFNTVGVVAVLPFANRFAALVVRLVPDRPAPFARRLDRALLSDPDAAIDALTATLAELSAKTFGEVETRLHLPAPPAGIGRGRDLVALAVGETRHYATRLTTSADLGATYERHLAALHALDHLARLLDRCAEEERWRALSSDAALRAGAVRLAGPLARTREALAELGRPVPEAPLRDAWYALGEEKSPFRRRVLERAAAGEIEGAEAVARFDAMRWLRRTAYHAWRIAHHLEKAHVTPTRAGADPGRDRGETSFGSGPDAVGEPAPHEEHDTPE